MSMSNCAVIAPRARRTMQVLAAAGLLAIAGALASAPSATAAEMCWSPQELRNVEGNQTVHKEVSRAFVPVPRSEVLPAAAGFRPLKGAIRRVTLPHGAPKLIALTFDLCEQPYEVAGYQGKVVDFLRDNSIKATFFAGGKWMMTHSGRAQQLMSDHLFEVANHTWEHRNLRIVSGSRLDDEIRGAQAAYEAVRSELVGRQCVARDGRPLRRAVPARMSLFRFPFGACNAKALEAVGENGLLAIQWDISAADPDPHVSSRAMADAVIRSAHSGSIVLFHANGRGWHTADALPAIVAELSKAHFKFVTVSELLNYPGAKWEVSEQCYDVRPHDTDRYDGLARLLEARYDRFYSRFAPSQSVPASGFQTQVTRSRPSR
jgi:peptidoglycan/xylan/chitin deacetylase (PgdA/CDA1 family)